MAHTSSESEYKLANMTTELWWVQSLLKELGILFISKPSLWSNNIGVIYMTPNPLFHSIAKDIELDYHFFYEQVSLGNNSVYFLCTNDHIGDIFTKPSVIRIFQQLFSKFLPVTHPLLS